MLRFEFECARHMHDFSDVHPTDSFIPERQERPRGFSTDKGFAWSRVLIRRWFLPGEPAWAEISTLHAGGYGFSPSVVRSATGRFALRPFAYTTVATQVFGGSAGRLSLRRRKSVSPPLLVFLTG